MRAPRPSPKRLLSLLAVIPLLSASAETVGLPAVREALGRSAIPEPARAAILERIEAEPKPFLADLEAALRDRAADPDLLRLVDRGRALPGGYEPRDLVALDGTGLSVSRPGHRLRKPAFAALASMDRAARGAGATLLVSSAYRSYEYQKVVWDRGVAAEGEAETDRSVARPGHSQHQLGTAVDFGSITDAFAKTK